MNNGQNQEEPKIMVKTFFNGWRAVTREQAVGWAKVLYDGMTAIPSFEHKLEYLNSRLKGITAEELFKNEDWYKARCKK